MNFIKLFSLPWYLKLFIVNYLTICSDKNISLEDYDHDANFTKNNSSNGSI